MSANSFGTVFKWMSFGESHGPAMGVVIDGCPSEVPFRGELLDKILQRRRPGQSSITSNRQEEDKYELLSGVYQEKTLGTPIALLVRNKNCRPQDYAQLEQGARRGHADDLWIRKFGHADWRGGGRASGRETVCRVLAGGVAQMLGEFLYPSLQVTALVSQIGPEAMSPTEKALFFSGEWSEKEIDRQSMRMPIQDRAAKMEQLLLDAKSSGQSFGGEILLRVTGAPAGLGQPVFHKLKADLAFALMSVGAVAGVEIGAGHESASERGTQFHERDSHVYGGIRGGISTGENIGVKLSFKPPASILDVAKKGRHDPCIVPRAVPVVEAMAWLVLVDHILWQRSDRVGLSFSQP